MSELMYGECPRCRRSLTVGHVCCDTIGVVPPLKVTLTDGSPVPSDQSHIQDRGDGQQKGYIVLSAEERAKGFVRPVRKSYKHVGIAGPKYPLRDLTAEEHERFDQFGYAKFEAYPKSECPMTGKYWTLTELGRINKGCRTVTTMASALAETYARDPKFYGGTFCCGCGAHFSVGEAGEFVWEETNERVGT